MLLDGPSITCDAGCHGNADIVTISYTSTLYSLQQPLKRRGKTANKPKVWIKLKSFETFK